MELQELRQMPNPEALPSDHLRALWYDLNGDWNTSHSIVQSMADINAMWIHAYLHRKEPDEWNAKYWYRRAGKPFPGAITFEAEVGMILAAFFDEVP